jgi:hypothetical protein
VIVPAALLPLKQHRFEVAAAALLAIVIGAAALWVRSKLLGLNVSQACFDAWMGTGGEPGPQCADPVRSFLEINESEAGKIFAAMAVLPFAVGLLGGVTLVGRELEARTAQTAWGLAASRRRWFVRQVWPILVVIGVTVTFAAVAATLLESARDVFPSFPFEDFGLYGPLVVARAFAALGLGLLAGAVMGRTLPALIVGVVLSIGILFVAGAARHSWMDTLPRVVLTQTSGGFVDALIMDQGWRTPTGTVITEMDAIALASPATGTEPYQWLQDNGYEMVNLGISGESTRPWEPMEIAAFGALGLVLLGATVVVVDRRRPI